MAENSELDLYLLGRLRPFGKYTFSYPSADSVVLKVYSFQGVLINIQRIKFESDNLMDVTMESIVDPTHEILGQGKKKTLSTYRFFDY